MNWAQKAMTGVFLSVALLVPVVASAVPLSVYESASSDPAKQIKIFNDAYSTAVSQTVTQLSGACSAQGYFTSGGPSVHLPWRTAPPEKRRAETSILCARRSEATMGSHSTRRWLLGDGRQHEWPEA